MAMVCDTIGPLQAFIDRHPRLFVLTGAGCSTDSGIPDYRDHNGQWKRALPITLQSFMVDASARRRYWARGLVGWPMFERARPNDGHRALAEWQRLGVIDRLVTQNVDGLHQRAGSQDVIDLHGRLDEVTCVHCAARWPRARWQAVLLERNPQWLNSTGVDSTVQAAPDGDADLEADFDAFEVPDCPHCQGLVKPDVVFFGETVPRPRVDAAFDGLTRADAMLVVGSSLMVYSGFRFARAAAESGKPVAAIALGVTRADPLLEFRLAMPCVQALTQARPQARPAPRS